MTERVEWDALPAEFRSAVEARTGSVVASVSVTSGYNCSLALDVRTRNSGRLFLKGVRVSDDAGMAGLLCEERINSVVGEVGPTVRYRFESAGWLALAFVHIEGRHVDYSPGTSDLDAVTLTARRMRRLRTPTGPVPQLSDRFADYLRPGEADALHGTHLLHTDTNPHNILICAHGGHAYLVDWAMPALGPPWVDAAYIATWLMAFGQTPEAALTWLAGIPSWQHADRTVVETFVEVTCRRWTARMGDADAAGSNAEFRHLLDTPRPRAVRRT